MTSVEDVAYGNGVKVVADLLWRLLKGRVEALGKAGVHVVFLAHADVRKHDDVEAGTSYVALRPIYHQLESRIQ